MPLRSAPTGGGSNVLQPAAPYSFDLASGGKYYVPDPLALGKITADVNAANLPSYLKFAGGVNAFNQNELMKQVLQGNPAYYGQLGQYTGMTTNQLAGMVPSDVENQVVQFGAERGAGTGTAGSPANNAAMMKAFYDTSKAQQAAGAQNFLNLNAAAPKAPLMDVASLAPKWSDLWNAQHETNVINAAPDPAAKHAADLAAVQAGIKAGAGSYGGGISPINPSAGNQDLLNKIISGYLTPTASPSPVAHGGGGAAYDPMASWYEQTYGNQRFGAAPGGSSPISAGPDGGTSIIGPNPNRPITDEEWNAMLYGESPQDYEQYEGDVNYSNSANYG